MLTRLFLTFSGDTNPHQQRVQVCESEQGESRSEVVAAHEGGSG